jgi:hypothetical protein
MYKSAFVVFVRNAAFIINCSFAIPVLPAICAAADTATSSGVIQGKVLLDNASPLSGATITAHRLAPAPTVTATVTTGKDGSFSLTGLPSGEFGVCVKESSGTLFDPCGWADLAIPISVKNGSISTGVVIRMKKIASVTVRVNDKGTFLKIKPGDAAPPHVLVGAFDAHGIFHPANQTELDKNGVTYQLTVPTDFPARINVSSAKLKLTDSLNNVLPTTGFAQTVVSPSTALQAKSFTFNVVGRK